MGQIYDGTHLWLFEPWNIHGGDVQKMIADCQNRGIDGVIIKCANGSLVNDKVSQRFMDWFKKLIGPFKAAGFTVGAWIYQYLTDVAGEVDACSQAIAAGADWIVFDAEIEMKGKWPQATQFLQQFRAKHPNVVTALSSFPIASYHTNEVPFAEYAKYVDVMMPQIYWNEMQWPMATAFHSAITDYKKYGKPIAPTGPTYTTATPADMAKFVQLCKDAGHTHVSWWVLDDATPAQLDAVQANRIVKPKPPVQAEDWRLREIQKAEANGFFTKGAHKPGEPVTIEVLAATMNNFSNMIKGGK
jgi:hypothetical protein